VLEHLHHRVREGRQVVAEGIDALLRRARLVFLEEGRDRREPVGDIGRVGLVVHDAVEERSQLRLERGELRAHHAAADITGL
jgi:hypothetical protein